VGGDACVRIDSGSTRQFQTFRSGNPAGCLNAPLEFRVGTPFDPEPSWWSYSALEGLEFGAAPMATDARLSSEDIAAKIQRLEGLLVDVTRAARWKRELNAPLRR
jgi:hypothetical protein